MNDDLDSMNGDLANMNSDLVSMNGDFVGMNDNLVDMLITRLVSNEQVRRGQLINQQAQWEFEQYMEYWRFLTQDELRQREYERRITEHILRNQLQKDLQTELDIKRLRFQKYGSSYSSTEWLKAQGYSRSSRHLFVVFSVHFNDSTIPNPMYFLKDRLKEQNKDFEQKKSLLILDTAEGFGTSSEAAMFYNREFIFKPAIIVYGLLSGNYLRFYATFGGVLENQVKIEYVNDDDIQISIEPENITLGEIPISIIEKISSASNELQKGKEKTDSVVDYVINSQLQLLIDYALIWITNKENKIWDNVRSKKKNRIKEISDEVPELGEKLKEFDELINRRSIEIEKISRSRTYKDDKNSNPFL
ncbi:MAG: hypothetical protein R3D00_24645 [Bacteroidia bacterium]